MRDDTWLLARLDELWNAYFSDIPQTNPVFIRFGRRAELRFGSIMMDPKNGHTIVTITGMFKDDNIPQGVVDHTIVHELCHYAHGFSSPHQRLHRYPHSGGVIKKEMEDRKALHLYKAYRDWLKKYQLELQKRPAKAKPRRRIRIIWRR